MTSIMKKEIFEEPTVVKNLFMNYVSEDGVINLDLPKKVDNIVIVASGSSYNCAAIAAPLFVEYAEIPCEFEYSSEFVLQKKHFITPDSLYIFVSQSGETSDTLNALKMIKEQGVKTMCITNAKDSSMWNLCDYKILSDAGEEKSIASTKALTAQIFCAILVMLKLISQKGEDISGYLNTMKRLPAYLERIKIDETVDITDKVCPLTFVKAKVAIDEIDDGQVIAIRMNDREPVQNVPRSIKEEGHQILKLVNNEDGTYNLLVKKVEE